MFLSFFYYILKLSLQLPNGHNSYNLILVFIIYLNVGVNNKIFGISLLQIFHFLVDTFLYFFIRLNSVLYLKVIVFVMLSNL